MFETVFPTTGRLDSYLAQFGSTLRDSRELRTNDTL